MMPAWQYVLPWLCVKLLDFELNVLEILVCIVNASVVCLGAAAVVKVFP